MAEIFKPKFDKQIDNNKKVFYSFIDEMPLRNASNNLSENPIETLNRLENNGTYLFSKRVIIRAKNKVYDTKIAGRMGNNIITIDSDTISLNDIISIMEK